MKYNGRTIFWKRHFPHSTTPRSQHWSKHLSWERVDIGPGNGKSSKLELMELENIVANTVYLKAREGTSSYAFLNVIQRSEIFKKSINCHFKNCPQKNGTTLRSTHWSKKKSAVLYNWVCRHCKPFPSDSVQNLWQKLIEIFQIPCKHLVIRRFTKCF